MEKSKIKKHGIVELSEVESSQIKGGNIWAPILWDLFLVWLSTQVSDNDYDGTGTNTGISLEGYSYHLDSTVVSGTDTTKIIVDKTETHFSVSFGF